MPDASPFPVPRCPQCGVELRPDAPSGLCPACLLARASDPISDIGGATTTLGGAARPLDGGPDSGFAPGQTFGSYRIVRLLGRGGMGDVYEAEQIEQGRRVALKVLSQRLTDPHDRARFLREGQLAASISHPHTVYIFGSEEIGGTPIIVMELLAGGTLKDRVRERGALPPGEAVDAILQVIAGLDAAQAGGILHRDVKPANCFIDRDGVVKVGDFGLSISTLTRDVTQLTRSGAFQGTPQFAAPEQVKGEPLDLRADIYAVGATLNYLLTGQPPFDAADLMALAARIATEAPRSPRALQAGVPRGLAAIVVRCLAKDRAARPPTYAALDEMLRPFGTAAATPAPIRLRFLAGAIDSTIMWLTFMPVNIPISAREGQNYSLWVSSIEAALAIAYYATLEGLWGASIGKRVVDLRITRADGQPAGTARAFVRAVVFQSSLFVPGTLLMLMVSPKRLFDLVAASPLLLSIAAMVYPVVIGLLFSTARRRNGFAALQDLASGTRVVRRPGRGARSVLDGFRDSGPAAPAGARQIGPYEVVRTLGTTDVGEILVGFDPSLRRHVWIHALSPGAAAVPLPIRDLSRPARLRWLSGRRSATEAWDAYEALDGGPLATSLDVPRTWFAVRRWLLDLAREIDAGLEDASITALGIDHVWITRNGYAKLLDFRAPGVPAGANQEEGDTLASGQTFLAAIARSVRHGATRSLEPWPLSVSALVETLARRGFTTWPEVAARIAALSQEPDRVGRGRRALPLIFCGAMPAMGVLTILLVAPLMSRVLTPQVMALNNALIRLSILAPNTGAPAARERAALEVYIAGRFRPIITDPQTWATPATARILGPRRALAERVVAEHPVVSTDEMTRATAALEPLLREDTQMPNYSSASGVSRLALAVLVFNLTPIALFGILWAFVLRGGLFLRACGIAVVIRDGKPASRLRALWRALLAWAPVPAAIWIGVRFGVAAGVGVGMLFLAGVIWALVHPTRGLQDRIAGTWLVPR